MEAVSWSFAGTRRMTVQVISEAGFARKMGPWLSQEFGGRRLCLVTDAGVRRAGLLDGALGSLEEAGWQLLVIDSVVADPPEAVVLEAAAAAREFKADVVMGFGGGSPMDVAKLLAVLLAGVQPLQAMYGVDQVKGGRLPLVQVPTTAGTGSEVTPIAIVTTGKTTKSGIVAEPLLADVAVLDAELTVGLPAHITAATGIDAMVHAIEAYTSARLKNPRSDAMAREALSLLSANLLTACRTGDDLAARQNMLAGANLAGQAFAIAPVAAVHALAYPLGGHFHIPHGLSNALVLPHVMRFNLPTAASQYAELARTMGLDGAGDALIDHMAALIRDSGLPSRLSEVGVGRQDLPVLAEAAMAQTRLLINNPRPVTQDDALRIYEQAF